MSGLVDYFVGNHAQFFYCLACALLIIEASIMGFSGPLLFVALGTFCTGLLIHMGVISGWEIEIMFAGVLTLIWAFVLWAPLKRIQGKGKVEDNSSDLIGQRVPVSETVTAMSGKVRHSGIDWLARLDENADVEEIASGQMAEISHVEGTRLVIKPILKNPSK